MFEEIIGQKLPKKILSNAIKSGKVNHAYIFYGNSGIGKMTVAKKFSQYLICKNGNACMSCTPCKQFLANTVDDFKIIDLYENKNEILVDQIREIVNDVYIRPHIFDKKICIVNNADKMNLNAQNAFLKVLEEPPDYAVFILIASSLSGILPTIKSRSCEVRFSELTSEELKEIFLSVYKTVLPDDIAAISDGSIKTALGLINSDETSILMKNTANAFLNFLKSGSEADMLRIYKIISSNETQKEMLLKIMYTVLTDCFVSQIGADKELIKISDCNGIKISDDNIRNLFLILNELSKRIKTNAGYGLTVLSAFSEMQKVLKHQGSSR